MLLLALLRATSSWSAQAADPQFVGAAAPGPAVTRPETHLAAELGGTFAGGNTRSYQLTASLDADHRFGLNKITLDTGGYLGRSMIDANGDGHLDPDERDAGWAETARKAWLDLRQDRFFGTRDSVYVLAGGLIDPFAGYDNRVHGQLGYSRILVRTPPGRPRATQVVTELGVDGAREDFVDGVTPETAYILAVRGMGGLTHALSSTVTFSEKVELFENVLTPLDLRVNNEVALTTKITDRFSFMLRHTVAFDNQPVDGFQRLDQTAQVSFIAAITPPKPAPPPGPCTPAVP